MRMMVAGGGTGGHLFPGMALAEELLARTEGNEVCFVGTERGLESRLIPKKGWRLEKISSAPLRGTGFFGIIRALLAVPRAILESIRIIRKIKPDIVIGVGGYASGPVVIAAWLLRVHRVICEQNTIPGTTNRILGHFAEAVFISFEESRKYFPKKRTLHLGNPIRKGLMDNYLRSKVPSGGFTVLVFGGSQGAHVLNTAMADAIISMAGRRDEITLIHQTGAADRKSIKARYSVIGFKAEVLEFIDDMASAYKRADLIVCRAGATTVAELGVCRKPSILVPYPFATDNHQLKNAQAIARAGAAVIIRQADLTGKLLAETILGLKDDRNKLLAMEAAAGAVGRPEAARECVDYCIELVGRR